MRQNNRLKVHILNVNHGDATIIELPDYGSPARAHFGVVDFGAKSADDRAVCRDYMQRLVDLRRDADAQLNYRIDFACVTHPHDDHYGGLDRFMNVFSDAANANQNFIDQFWDCGFRTTSATYNRTLSDIINNNNIKFVRLSSGTEFELGEVRIFILAPSIDLRNRFDTYGVGKNDASIVMKVQYRNSTVILGADAEFASWGKTTEEFPRTSNITFFDDALGLAERGETADQLKCDLLKVAHHGSKHGSSLEYLERLQPNRVVYCAGSDPWYQANKPNWRNKFPHQLVTNTLDVLDDQLDIYTTGTDGNILFQYAGNWGPSKVTPFTDRPGDANFDQMLLNAWLT